MLCSFFVGGGGGGGVGLGGGESRGHGEGDYLIIRSLQKKNIKICSTKKINCVADLNK